MPTLQEQYDDAMFDFSTGDYVSAIRKVVGLVHGTHDRDESSGEAASRSSIDQPRRAVYARD